MTKASMIKESKMENEGAECVKLKVFVLNSEQKKYLAENINI